MLMIGLGMMGPGQSCANVECGVAGDSKPPILGILIVGSHRVNVSGDGIYKFIYMIYLLVGYISYIYHIYAYALLTLQDRTQKAQITWAQRQRGLLIVC